MDEGLPPPALWEVRGRGHESVDRQSSESSPTSFLDVDEALEDGRCRYGERGDAVEGRAPAQEIGERGVTQRKPGDLENAEAEATGDWGALARFRSGGDGQGGLPSSCSAAGGFVGPSP